MKIAEQTLVLRPSVSGSKAAPESAPEFAKDLNGAQEKDNASGKAGDKAGDKAMISDAAALLAALQAQMAVQPKTSELAETNSTEGSAKKEEVSVGTQGAQAQSKTGTTREVLAALTQPSTLTQAPWSREWVFEEKLATPPVGDAKAGALKAVIPGAMPGARGVDSAERNQDTVPSTGVKSEPQAPAAKPQNTNGQTIQSDVAFAIESLQVLPMDAEALENPVADSSAKQDSDDKSSASAAKKVQDFSGSEFVLTKQALNPTSKVRAGDTEARDQGNQTITAQSLNPKAKDPRRNEVKAMPETQILGNATAASILHAKNAQPTPVPSAFNQSGIVVKGSMAKDRLSSESLMNLTGNIRSSTLNPQGGEIRLRLAPDNLGEVRLKISSIGNHVKLNVQASSEKAKQIIEDSMGYLREALNSNQLTLTKVDIGVASPSQGSSSQSQTGSHNDSSQNLAMNLQQGQDGGNRGQNYRDAVEDRELGGSSGVNFGSRGSLKNAGPGMLPTGLSSMSGARASGHTPGLSSLQRIDIRV